MLHSKRFYRFIAWLYWFLKNQWALGKFLPRSSSSSRGRRPGRDPALAEGRARRRRSSDLGDMRARETRWSVAIVAERVV